MAERTIRHIIEGQEPVTARANITVGEAARIMKERKVGALAVVDGETLVGVFTERDGLYRVLAAGRDGEATPLSDVMTKRPQTVAPDVPFAQALHIMHEGGFREVPVVDGGRLIGVVSVRDALGSELESFVFELLRQEQMHQVLA
jgi:CBS domain-containing protein